MALSSASKLYIVELAIYTFLLPLSGYLGWRHGRHGVLGYFYLNAFCAVRLAADIVSLLPAYRDATRPTTATAVLSSVGLSPLILGLSGLLHEAHIYLVHTTARGEQEKRIRRWLWLIQLHAHIVSITGMVLVIIGSVNLATKQRAQAGTDNDLRKAGALLLLILWAFLALYAMFLFRLTQNIVITTQKRATFTIWTTCILAASSLVGVRYVFSVLYIFDSDDNTFNPFTGALWVKVIFVVLAPLAAVASMCLGGWASRDMSMGKMYEDGVDAAVGREAVQYVSDSQNMEAKAPFLGTARN